MLELQLILGGLVILGKVESTAPRKCSYHMNNHFN